MARSDDSVAETESSRVATTRVLPGSEVAIIRYWGPARTCRPAPSTSDPTVTAAAEGR